MTDHQPRHKHSPHRLVQLRITDAGRNFSVRDYDHTGRVQTFIAVIHQEAAGEQSTDPRILSFNRIITKGLKCADRPY